MKFVIQKIKGAFYAGSEKIAEKGLKLKRYIGLDGIKKMVNALHLSSSSLIFRGLNKNEQIKISKCIHAKKSTGKRKASEKKKKTKCSSK